MKFNLRYFKRSGKWYMDKEIELGSLSHMADVCKEVRAAHGQANFIIEIESAKDEAANSIFYPCLLL